MVFRCSPLFSVPVRFTPFSRGVEATAFRLSPLEYPQGQTRLPAKVPAPKPDVSRRTTGGLAHRGRIWLAEIRMLHRVENASGVFGEKQVERAVTRRSRLQVLQRIPGGTRRGTIRIGRRSSLQSDSLEQRF